MEGSLDQGGRQGNRRLFNLSLIGNREEKENPRLLRAKKP